MADFERYIPPDPCLPQRYAEIEELVAAFAGDKAVVVQLRDVFSLPRYWLGMENLLMSLIAQPDLVRAVVELSVDLNLRSAKEVAARGVKIVYAGDDYAYTRGPLMSPKHFRDFFYPGFKRFVTGLKELGLIFIKHTDGDLWPILDMIVDAGIDCLDPIDPMAGMKIAEVKAQYGHRIALKGNVDCAQTLTFGTEEEVVEDTKEALRQGMPGGGFILSSSNSIVSATKPENYVAMLNTWKRYRDYPMVL
jgi:uroporphyrinogen decarboxylase